MNLYKEYVDTNKSNVKIKFTISFNKDSHNWATGKPKEIGYQLIATPVEKGDGFESFQAFTGFYKIIYPINRQSSKRLQTAIDIFQEQKPTFIEWFKNNGYEFE